MDADIDKAIAAFYANPDADQQALLRALDRSGIAPRKSWELYQFLPIAFVHVAFRGQGVRFMSEYLLEDTPGSSSRSRHRFVDEPIYVAGVAAAESRISEGHAPIDLRPVFSHSAEYAVILELIRPDGSLDGIRLVEPVLFEYEE